MRPEQEILIAGVDEAGRGPLAGPVVAAAVILPGAERMPGLADSKKLSAARRQQLAVEIRATALAWAVAQASVAEIDRLNILQASLLAMRRAVVNLAVRPAEVWIDGNQAPELAIPSRTFVRGDARIAAISAASILAKVERDQHMLELDEIHPGYGFARHKGYATKAHREALQRLGACALHRRSFAPVQQALFGTGATAEQPGHTLAHKLQPE
ncbi:MAG TPA: ribonuclease HII [Salinisphaeraceae bacterium]|nr:ribonuclease HII [Salinisphaeraceae bacterium]